MSERRNRTALATLIWQFVCLAMIECHRHLLAPVLMHWYTARFGDPQQDYAKFETFMLVSGYLIQTAVATVITLLLIEWLQSGGSRWRRLALGFVLWEVAVLAAIFAGHQLQIGWAFHQLDWYFFGPLEPFHSFRNFLLPRLLEWLLCTVPVGFVATGLIVHRPGARSDPDKAL